MKNNKHKIFIIVYLLILLLPILLLIFQIKVEPINEKEKKIGLNFKRNFPLKADLFKAYMSLKVNVFKTDPIPNALIETSDGEWKFLGNKFSNVLSESKGIITFNPKELDIIKKNLLDKKQWLEERDIPFYLTIAPSKHRFYGDKIPIKKRDRKTKSEQLDSICKTIDIKFVDLGEKFNEEKEQILFLKTDSHWNHLGGYYAFQSTIEAIAKDFPNTSFNFFKKDMMRVFTVNSDISDLNDMLFLPRTERSIAILPKDTTRKLNKLPKTLSVPSDYHFNPNGYEERYQSDRNDLNIMVLRDSFFGAYFHLIADNFGKSTFIFWHDFSPKLFESEKPDLLVYEIQERNLDILLDKDWHHAPN